MGFTMMAVMLVMHQPMSYMMEFHRRCMSCWWKNASHNIVSAELKANLNEGSMKDDDNQKILADRFA